MIDVHIGFMDEEVSELLKCLVEQFGNDRPVIAVERARIEKEGFLFETPFKKYQPNKSLVDIVYPEDVSAENYDPGGKSLQHRLAYYIHNELHSEDNPIKKRVDSSALKTAKLKLKPGDIKLSVIRFNKDTETKNPIILVRNPEMGAQPSIVRPYERAIFKAISRLEEAHQPSSNERNDAGVRLHSFASGGAINPGVYPGTISRPMASLYIGSEVDEDGRVYSVVNLAAIRNIPPKLWPQHVEFYRDETTKTYVWGNVPITSEMKKEEIDAVSAEINEDVKKSVQWFVLDSGDSLLESTLKCLSECYRLGSFKYEPIIFRGQTLNSDTPEITANFSYFDDLTMKGNLYKKFGNVVVNSNMEDYHVLRLARSMVERGGQTKKGVIPPHRYARLIDVEILRVNANVNISLPAVQTALDGYLGAIRLSNQEYIESIMWGLKGCPLGEVGKLPPRVNQWGVYMTLKGNEDLAKYIYTYTDGAEQIYCMDPFCCEIATDLLKEMANKDNNYDEKLRDAAGAAITEAKHHAWDDDWTKTRDLVGKFVNLMYEEYKDEFSGSDSMYCWLRPGKKWNGLDRYRMLTKEAGEIFLKSEENVDRLFYKSANLLALQQLAPIVAKRSKI
ncbi:MAG TPA: hypothetical protein VFY40_02600 [Blastocatellia bacterium]|nr:hypothetical protein [Blastocatellia bacterium]